MKKIDILKNIIKKSKQNGFYGILLINDNLIRKKKQFLALGRTLKKTGYLSFYKKKKDIYVIASKTYQNINDCILKKCIEEYIKKNEINIKGEIKKIQIITIDKNDNLVILT